jgi:hypothetical protein
MGPRNGFQGMNSASLWSLAGRYDNPIPTRCLAPIDCLKIPALTARYENRVVVPARQAGNRLLVSLTDLQYKYGLRYLYWSIFKKSRHLGFGVLGR